MKFTEMSEAVQVLAKLSSPQSNITLPVVFSYAVNRNLEKIRMEFSEMEAERMKLCEIYCMKDETGKLMTVKKDLNGVEVDAYCFEKGNEEKFNADFKELMDLDVSIDIRKIPFDLIQKCEDSNGKYYVPTVAEMRVLDFMIE